MKDLGVTQAGRALVLSFTAPGLATDGRRLTEPLEVEIFRQATGRGTPQSSAFTSPTPLKPFASIEPQELRQFEHGNRITYRVELTAGEYSRSVGTVFAFRVVTLTRGFRGHPHRGEPSNIATTELLDVSPPLVNLIVRQAPHALELEWSAPKASLTGGPLPAIAGYRVYRGVKTQPGEPVSMGKASSTAYRDTHFQFGETYIYRVAAIFTSGGYTATSAESEPVEITPREIFPPPAPAGLTAVYTGTAVELIWKPEIEPNLAGYNVYRQEPGKPGQRLNPALLRTPAFSDGAIMQGAKYVYWVTAIDAAKNESAPSARVAVETR
ncbi:MAG: fibronectin type III domain-containing protein [Terriglobia bacterium]